MSREWIWFPRSFCEPDSYHLLVNESGWGQFQSSSELESQCHVLAYGMIASKNHPQEWEDWLLAYQGLRPLSNQKNNLMIDSLHQSLSLFPGVWSPRKREMAVIQYEKARTHSSSNIEMHGIIKGFDSRVRLGRQLLQGFDWHSEEDFPSKRRKDCEVLLPHQKGTAQLCHLARALKKKRLQLRRTNGEPHQKRLETKCELQSHSLQEKVVECVRRREYST